MAASPRFRWERQWIVPYKRRETPHCVYGSRSKTITETKYGAFRRCADVTGRFYQPLYDRKDAKAVSEDGTPLEEYTSSQLERAVTRIKKERHEKQEAVEREVSKQREKDEAVSKNAAQLAVDGNVPDAVIDRLLDSDLR